MVGTHRDEIARQRFEYEANQPGPNDADIQRGVPVFWAGAWCDGGQMGMDFVTHVDAGHGFAVSTVVAANLAAQLPSAAEDPENHLSREDRSRLESDFRTYGGIRRVTHGHTQPGEGRGDEVVISFSVQSLADSVCLRLRARRGLIVAILSPIAARGLATSLLNVGVEHDLLLQDGRILEWM